MEERAGFVEADGFGVGKKIESAFRRNAAVEELILGGPGVEHGAIVQFFGARVSGKERGSDVVRLASVSKSEEWARSGDHAMTLVLAVGCVADFFRERVVGVLQGAHHRGVNADIESFEAVEIASGVQEAIKGLGVAAL